MNDRHRRIVRAWKHIEHHKVDVSWAKKSWVSRSGIPELVNYPADPEGQPEPSFETALEAVEADTRRSGKWQAF
jgi:hypothetical protein